MGFTVAELNYLIRVVKAANATTTQDVRNQSVMLGKLADALDEQAKTDERWRSPPDYEPPSKDDGGSRDYPPPAPPPEVEPPEDDGPARYLGPPNVVPAP